MEALHAGMAPTDEMIYSYVISYTPELFDPYTGEYGACLKNIMRTRRDEWLVLTFLQISFDKGNHYYTWKTADNLRRGFLNGDITLSTEDIHKVWYYNYVANYWLQKQDYCWTLLDEYYAIALEREDVANHIRGIFDFFKSMISYMDDKEIVARFDRFGPEA
jgi:hypothetical protein